MEEETEDQTPATTSPWGAAITCSAVLAILIGGALFVMHQQMLDRLSAEVERVDASVTQLTTRIASLESQTAAIAAASQPDPTPLDALNAGITSTNSKVGELTTRLDALEKKQQRVATPVAAITVDHVAAAPAPAPAPVINDALLRAQLVDILATLPKAPTAGETATFVEKINDRFAGFISIKKHDAVDVYEPLRTHAATADLPMLEHDINQLTDTQRKPFESWIASYHAALAGDATPKKKGH